jgi:hypothetical protein
MELPTQVKGMNPVGKCHAETAIAFASCSPTTRQLKVLKLGKRAMP